MIPQGAVRQLNVAPLLPGSPFRLTTLTVDCSTATVGAPVIQACRPLVTLTTLMGTPFQDVPIAWAITAGGGTVAPQDPASLSCGAFGATSNSTTGPLGKTGACWSTGASAGVNTLVAIPGIGGDAVVGVSFYPPSLVFNVTGVLTTPTVTVTGGSFAYDGAAHAGSGTCSDGLTPAITYSGGSAPVNAGATSVTVTCGAGNPLFVTVSATASITINQVVATATAGSGSLTLGVSASSLPCVVSGLLPADVGSVTCATTVGAVPTVGTYATTPVVSPPSPVNYAVSAVAGSVTYTPYVKSACFAAPINATDTRSPSVLKGTPVTVSCTLQTSGGAQAAGVVPVLGVTRVPSS